MSMTLVVLAAGMGSRYGGLKQLDPFTAHGEFLTDFSAYDAYVSGFDKIVFVIKPENEEIFRRTVGARIEKKMEVVYAFQTADRFVPTGTKIERTKPWGTGQALLCCEDVIDGNFFMINCDDLYGRGSYKIAADYLKALPDNSDDFAMCGFNLRNTLSETGSVSRGICEVKDGFLASVTERTNIFEEKSVMAPDAIVADDGTSPRVLSYDAVASMNAWCFTKKIFPILREYFTDFVNGLSKEEEAKKEFYIPFAVDRAMKEGRCTVKVLTSDERWYGVTYAHDKDRVKAHLADLTEKGVYPSPLF